MSIMIPTKVFLTKGKGQHKEKLASFEEALRDAGIAPFNLVKVSSIFPPHAKLISREEGLKYLNPGQIVFLVMSENATDEPHRLISASVALAIPHDPKHYGYLAEYQGFGPGEKEIAKHAEDLAVGMLATKLGWELPAGKINRNGNQDYELSKTFSVTAQNMTQTAEGAAGVWTTAVAAAVLIV